METVVTTCGGCGAAVRVRSPQIARRRVCPRCRTVLEVPIPGPDLSPGPTLVADGAARESRAALPRLAYLLTTLTILSLWLGETVLTANPSTIQDGAEPARLTDRHQGRRPVQSREPSRKERTPTADGLPSGFLPSNWRKPLSRSMEFGRRGLPDARSRVDAVRLLAMLTATGPLSMAADLDVGRYAMNGLGLSPDRAAMAAPRDDRPEIAPVLTPPNFGAPSIEALAAACRSKGIRRFAVRDDDGRPVVARLHGHRDGKTIVLLPDGRLGIPSMVVPTDEPFVPISGDAMEKRLQSGSFAEFQVARTAHYVILYQSSKKFAEHQGELLEELYARLIEAFRKHDVPVHETEFPLVAVIFRDESDFRTHRKVDPDVRAYYEIFSNRIFLFEKSDRDGIEPEISALLSTQTAAHEGTHQILQNIGVQPRLSAWPPWLVEGLAEYCASPASSRKGEPTWDGLGQINSLHMATLRELDDPLSISMREPDDRVRPLTRRPGQPIVETMICQTDMSPTDYALAWAVTHYLALKRGPEFTRFLTLMGQTPPLLPRTPEDHVRDFRAAFGDDLARMDKTIDGYLRKLARHKGYDPMPYYAVMFEQPRPPGLVRRAAMVSQSPQVIQKWVRALSGPDAGMVSWQAIPHPTRARATLATQEWLRGY